MVFLPSRRQVFKHTDLHKLRLYESGEFEIYPEWRKIYRGRREIDLTTKEYYHLDYKEGKTDGNDRISCRKAGQH